MADQGFTIKDLLFDKKVKMAKPSFIKKNVDRIRSHVERTIRCLIVYKILLHIAYTYTFICIVSFDYHGS